MPTTYYQRDTARAVGYTTRPQELALEATTATQADVSASIAASASLVGAFAFTTDAGIPNQAAAAWAGSFTAQINVISATSLTYSIVLSRVSSDATTVNAQLFPLSNATGTGLKSGSVNSTGNLFATGATTASRFAVGVGDVSNSDMMSAQNLTLRLNTTDSYVTVPWSSGSTVNATLSASLGALTATASAVVEHPATLTASLGGLTATASATVQPPPPPANGGFFF